MFFIAFLTSTLLDTDVISTRTRVHTCRYQFSSDYRFMPIDSYAAFAFVRRICIRLDSPTHASRQDHLAHSACNVGACVSEACQSAIFNSTHVLDALRVAFEAALNPQQDMQCNLSVT